MHVHVLLHGMSGNVSHLAEAVRIFRVRHENSVHLLVPASFSGKYTLDGIDFNAHRVLLELTDAISTLQKNPAVRITKFSITGYSLGGLIARYLIGILHSRRFFDSVEAVNFTSFTTPHAGIPAYPYTSRILSWLGSTLLGRTGKQLYLLDNYTDSGLPLLQVMVQPESSFYRGLSKFRNVRIYANAINDVTVPYFSGAFEAADPFATHSEQDIVPQYLPDYEPLIGGFSVLKSSASFSTRLNSIRPLTFNGPFITWTYPWKLLLFLVLPLIALVAVAYLPINHIFNSRASRARIRAFGDATMPLTLGSPRTALDPPPASTLMSPQQAEIVRALNSLEHVHKHTAYRPSVRNSHAMLICLEPRFADHRAGRGVLRHWADHFEV